MATFIPGGKFIAAGLFILACVTDFLDGYFARKYNQVTDLGKFFDAIADKVLMMTGLILIIGVPVRSDFNVIARPVEFVSVCIIIMLAREFIISALRQIAGAKGKVLAAEWSGKIKATLQYITISLYLVYAGFIQDTSLLLGEKADLANVIINVFLLILLTITTLLTISSGLGYIFKNRSVLTSGNKNAVNPSSNVNSEKVEENQVTTEDKEANTKEKKVSKTVKKTK
jgi:CDP-diacylglycerol--glycerol-3-phosphate 3-phosphatidyltransferase